MYVQVLCGGNFSSYSSNLNLDFGPGVSFFSRAKGTSHVLAKSICSAIGQHLFFQLIFPMVVFY